MRLGLGSRVVTLRARCEFEFWLVLVLFLRVDMQPSIVDGGATT